MFISEQNATNNTTIVTATPEHKLRDLAAIVVGICAGILVFIILLTAIIQFQTKIVSFFASLKFRRAEKDVEMRVPHKLSINPEAREGTAAPSWIRLVKKKIHMKILYISQNIEQLNLIIWIRLWHEVLNVYENVYVHSHCDDCARSYEAWTYLYHKHVHIFWVIRYSPWWNTSCLHLPCLSPISLLFYHWNIIKAERFIFVVFYAS